MKHYIRLAVEFYIGYLGVANILNLICFRLIYEAGLTTQYVALSNINKYFAVAIVAYYMYLNKDRFYWKKRESNKKRLEEM